MIRNGYAGVRVTNLVDGTNIYTLALKKYQESKPLIYGRSGGLSPLLCSDPRAEWYVISRKGVSIRRPTSKYLPSSQFDSLN